MDNGASNHRSKSSHGIALTRSTTTNNDNFTLASNRAAGRRFSNIEASSSSGSSDISNWENEAPTVSNGDSGGAGEIHTRNIANHRREHDINYRDFDEPGHQRQFRHHRWTVNSSVEKLPIKSNVIDKNGFSNYSFASTNINDVHSTNSSGDKAKWTHKAPINGNIAV